MSKPDLVRPSRDGDQFHYWWAARRCLRLLDSHSELVAVTIEDKSRQEDNEESGVDEIVDVGEYYGSEHAEEAKEIHYYQLKHSTLQTDTHWTESGLENTIKKFSKKYSDLISKHGAEKVHHVWRFHFISNRKIRDDIVSTVESLAKGIENCEKSKYNKLTITKLKQYTGFDDETISDFCKILNLSDSEGHIIYQRNLLHEELSGYLPGNDADAPLSIKELVTRKATSEFEKNPTINKWDILRELKVDESELFPAECQIESIDNIIPRDYERCVIDEIVKTNTFPVLLHAEGGAGKTVFASKIKDLLPDGSITVLYDCFGNGSYLSPSKVRHRHKQGIVQIANELASKCLCYPLIPTKADDLSYIKAFQFRLNQAVDNIKQKNKNALLCIVIDAADNSEIAADKFKEHRSFARDLIDEEYSDNIRLIFTTRSHRISSLSPSSKIKQIKLSPFNLDETGTFLKKYHPSVSKEDIQEFHTLSSANPRVQQTALEEKPQLRDVFKYLGPSSTTLDDLYQKTMDECLESMNTDEQVSVKELCKYLSILKPPVSLNVLAKITGLDESFIRSFVADIKRPLFINLNIIQYRDEPSETWFREKFNPVKDDYIKCVNKLAEFADENVYISSIIPYLLLEAGQLDKLIELASGDSWLPENKPLEARKIKLERLEFAFKASLRNGRYLDATKIGLRGGREAAAGNREKDLIRENTDIVSMFTDINTLLEVSHNKIEDMGWMGSKNAYKACLLSFRSDFIGEARSKLRVAEHWLTNWNKQPKGEFTSYGENPTDKDRAEFALAHLNVNGAKHCSGYLRRWRDRSVSFTAGRLLIKRLIDHGCFEDIDNIAHAAGNDFYLILAINFELRKINKMPPLKPVKKAFKFLSRESIIFEIREHNVAVETTELEAISAFIETIQIFAGFDKTKILSIISRYKGKNYPEVRYTKYAQKHIPYLKAYILFHIIEDKELNFIDFAEASIKKKGIDEQGNFKDDSYEIRDFNRNIKNLLPWISLYYDVVINCINKEMYLEKVENNISETEKVINSIYSQENIESIGHIARIWFSTICSLNSPDKIILDRFTSWFKDNSKHIYYNCYEDLANLAMRNEFSRQFAFELVTNVYKSTIESKSVSEEKLETFIRLSRICLAFSKDDAEAYYNEAVAVASKIGEENLSHWNVTLDIANTYASPDNPDQVTAYRLARSSEALYRLINKKYFDWDEMVRTLVNICPSSSLTIMSRWRDRKFDRYQETLPITIKQLIELDKLSPIAGLTLTCIKGRNWDISFLLESIFKDNNPEERQKIYNYFYRYFRLSGLLSSDWRNIEDVVNRYGIDTEDIKPLIDFALKDEKLKNIHCSTGLPEENDEEEKIDWDNILTSEDILIRENLLASYKNFREYQKENYTDLKVFFVKMFDLVEVGKETELISLFLDIDTFEYYGFEAFFDAIPESCKSRLAVQRAMKDLINRFISRCPTHYSLSHKNSGKLVKKIIENNICSVSDLAKIILDSAGKSTESFDSEAYFSLVRNISILLNKEDAYTALDFALLQFETEVEKDDADGDWNETIYPPDSANKALAGYLYALLATPKAALRWEAAHVICGLFKFNQTEVIEELVHLVENSPDGGPFVDKNLLFYKFHALQWLMIAMLRASTESPETVSPYIGFLLKYANKSYKHIIIRQFTADTVVNIIKSGCLEDKDGLLEGLLLVNTSEFPYEKSEGYRINGWGKGSNIRDKYSLEYDFSRYWLDNLCDCFDVSHQDIESKVGSKVVDEWGLKQFTHWDHDQRKVRRYMRDEDYRHSHGSYPKDDDMCLYLSFHSMMFTAGELLDEYPVFINSFKENTFEYLINRYSITRKDGRWIFDNRDYTPLNWPDWKTEDLNGDNWLWSLKRSDFKRVFDKDDSFIVWGSWEDSKHGKIEDISITSSLVSRKNSMALKRALQATDDPFDFYLPDSGDDREIDDFGYELKGWLSNVSTDSDSGIDRFDTWGGKLSYPPLKPAKYIQDLFKLKHNYERKMWSDSDGQACFLSQSWLNEEKDARRLTVYKEFLFNMLHKLDKDLIISIEIERSKDYGAKSYFEEESSYRDRTSCLIILITAIGEIHGL